MVEIYTVNKITKSEALCDEDYVIATDYAALEAENAELRKELAALREVIAPRWRRRTRS